MVEPGRTAGTISIGVGSIIFAWLPQFSLTQIKEGVTIFVLLATLTFTVVQLMRSLRRNQDEIKLAELVRKSHAKCPKALSGDCPLADLLSKLEERCRGTAPTG